LHELVSPVSCSASLCAVHPLPLAAVLKENLPEIYLEFKPLLQSNKEQSKHALSYQGNLIRKAQGIIYTHTFL